MLEIGNVNIDKLIADCNLDNPINPPTQETFFFLFGSYLKDDLSPDEFSNREQKILELLNSEYFKNLTFQHKVDLLVNDDPTKSPLKQLPLTKSHNLLWFLFKIRDMPDRTIIYLAKSIMEDTFLACFSLTNETKGQSQGTSDSSTDYNQRLLIGLINEDLKLDDLLTIGFLLKGITISQDKFNDSITKSEKDSLFKKTLTSFKTTNQDSYEEESDAPTVLAFAQLTKAQLHTLFLARSFDLLVNDINSISSIDLLEILVLAKKYLDNNNQLEKALYDNSISKVQNLLATKYNSEQAKNKGGSSTFRSSNRESDVKYIIYQALLGKIDQSQVISEIQTDIRLLRFLITFTSPKDQKCLGNCAQHSQLNALMTLLNDQFYLDVINKKIPPTEYTAIEYAIYSKNLLMVELLVYKGADVTTAPTLAIAVNNSDLLMVQFLISKGASIYKRNSDGKAPLQIAGTLRDNEANILLIKDLEKAHNENLEKFIANWNSDSPTPIEEVGDMLHYIFYDYLFTADEALPLEQRERKIIELLETKYFKGLKNDDKSKIFYELHDKKNFINNLIVREAHNVLWYLLHQPDLSNNSLGLLSNPIDVLLGQQAVLDRIKKEDSGKGKAKLNKNDKEELESNQSYDSDYDAREKLFKNEYSSNRFLTFALFLKNISLSQQELTACTINSPDESIFWKTYSTFIIDDKQNTTLTTQQAHALFIAKQLDEMLEFAINGSDNERNENYLPSIINLAKYLDNYDPNYKALYDAFIENVKDKLIERYRDEVCDKDLNQIKHESSLMELLANPTKNSDPFSITEFDQLYKTYLILLLFNKKTFTLEESEVIAIYIEEALLKEDVNLARLIITSSNCIFPELLHRVVSLGHLSIAHVLVSNEGYKQHINAKFSSRSTPNGKESSPLEVAIENENSSMVQILIHHGADLRAKNADGKTPLEIVEERMKKKTGQELRNIKQILKMAKVNADKEFKVKAKEEIKAQADDKTISNIASSSASDTVSPTFPADYSSLTSNTSSSASSNSFSGKPVPTSSSGPSGLTSDITGTEKDPKISGDSISTTLTPSSPSNRPINSSIPANPNKPIDKSRLIFSLGLFAFGIFTMYRQWPKIIDRLIKLEWVSPAFKTSPHYFKAQVTACVSMGALGVIGLNYDKVLSAVGKYFTEPSIDSTKPKDNQPREKY